MKILSTACEDLEHLMGDRRIIRHWGKIKAVRDNARAVIAIAGEHGSFGHYLAGWPADEIIELWFELRRRCRQLGGNSAPYFLRMAGKDTFLITQDVLRALHAWGVDAGTGRRRGELRRIESAFNQWRIESKRPHAAVSMILAWSLPR
jgi:3-methyladenine DNA glycosylase Tag